MTRLPSCRQHARSRGSGARAVLYFAGADAVVYLKASGDRRSVRVRCITGDVSFCRMPRRRAHRLWVERGLEVQKVIALLPLE
jgi:hypothetical protein